MPRSIWKGAISFGLINVPVKMYSAVSRKDVRFHQLHDKDGVRIKQKRICPADNEEVSYENIVKGYEISPGEYVVIEPKELDALDAEKTQTIDIDSFVGLDEIDPFSSKTRTTWCPTRLRQSRTRCFMTRSPSRTRWRLHASSCTRKSTWQRCVRPAT